ncbi:hypothetical protein [Burkholderia vietnamiensis]|uniref:hypothetical protein n=1 Tax=Burkholderia vietnamiensis TaxID=60552 RepID=UPI002651918F|nr:hypothetical protein [Burkholderia vietnamiensis]MDN8042538.1 hypothetical protein [Burkholderia vietnamiensis]HDR9132721.1 hypothetical protein [Burkholderia vietnamiensis]HDR9202393.1 hypothetical protein [Burkholderia vietnamiensis]
MTITAAWVRTLKDCKELIVVSDSRLNGGKKMDCGQKIHILPRSDAFICFAGDTSWAYPLMHQVISAVSTYERSSSRAQDIVELKSHVLKVFESLRNSVHDASGDEGIPSAEFLFGGYSWIRKKFMIWRIHFQKGSNSFEANPAKEWKGNPWVFAGDKEHVERARERLSELMKSRKCAPHQIERFKFEWEPFEVIRDMLREIDANKNHYKNESIGGAPQIMKIYEHLSAKYLAVDWNISHQKDGNGIYVCGRKILGYETPSLWVLNPDTLVTRHPLYSDTEPDLNDEPSEEERYDLTPQLTKLPKS